MKVSFNEYSFNYFREQISELNDLDLTIVAYMVLNQICHNNSKEKPCHHNCPMYTAMCHEFIPKLKDWIKWNTEDKGE